MFVFPLNQSSTYEHKMVTDAKPLQPSKALEPIDVTLMPRVTDVIPLQK